MARKYQRPLPESPACDPQRSLVYRMENEAIGATRYASMTKAAIGRLIRSLCRSYRTLPVALKFAALGMSAGAEWESPNIITLNTDMRISRDLLTVTHEFAHHLHDSVCPEAEHEAHGPEFMCCHMSVLDTVRYIPTVGMKAICESYGIRYRDPGPDLASLKLALQT